MDIAPPLASASKITYSVSNSPISQKQQKLGDILLVAEIPHEMGTEGFPGSDVAKILVEGQWVNEETSPQLPKHHPGPF